MIHYYDVNIAEEYGIEEAILIQNFAFWIEKNTANNVHFHDGRYWTYCSASALLKLFPEFNSLTALKRIVQNIVDKGILQKGNYNKTPMDRTVWYAFTDKGIELIEEYGLYKVQNQQMESPKTDYTKSENGQPIPYNVTDKDDNSSLRSELSESLLLNPSTKNNNSTSTIPYNPLSKAKPKKKPFTKPTIEEITDYCKERGNNIDPQSFFDYYESKGWLVGKTSMVDWKAAVRNWERNNYNNYSNGTKSSNNSRGTARAEQPEEKREPDYNFFHF